jgi:phosphohistidine phosphatase
LIRHAEAVDETLALRDPHRHLTPKGRHQAKQLGDRLRWHDCKPAVIFASPCVRAVQTAELVIGQFEDDHPIEILPALAPGQHPRDLIALLSQTPAGHCAFLVGHEPGLSGIGALLTHDPDFATLAKAQAARIVDGALRWRFAWDADAPVAALPAAP